ncbi:hypothetical protein AURDEDRAFT_165578 [Auricularia subglabra TFB-10046 SS5]|nr:hypothetical protein AURDEDRAFT_165578 [Auricularia subglabra TFB-10046 SS5]
MHAALGLLALASLAAAAPKPKLQYNLYNNGSRGSVNGQADDFSATFHTSAFMSRQGCSSTAKITYCYAAELSGNLKKMLETKDYKPYINGGVGTHQRAYLLSQPYPTKKTGSGVITHKLRFHISSTYNKVPVGLANAVTFTGLRNFNPKVGIKALDIRARTFTGEETSGTFLYVAAVDQDKSEAFPTSFPLKDAIGKTIEVTYKIGLNGATVDSQKVFVATVAAKFVDTGKQLFSVGVTKTLYPKGVIDATAHRLIFGGSRQVSSSMKDLKVWFGDYSVSPLPPKIVD